MADKEATAQQKKEEDKKADLEDSDEESPERFNDPNDLMEILNNLEESNLTQITRMQQSEEQLEIKKQQKQKVERS